MSFRDFIETLKKKGNLITINKPVSKKLEVAGYLKKYEESPVLFTNVIGGFKIAGNVFSKKERIADYFGIKPQELIQKMINAIENPTKPEIVENAPCQEVVLKDIDLDKLPILFHTKKDGGNYITSGIVITKDKEFGQNMDFHRMMQIEKHKFSVRVVSDRHFDQFLKKNKRLEIAVCIGNSPNILLAAATSVNIGQDELEIANSLEPLKVVKTKTSKLLIPADCEFVLEGIIRLNERANEGPFVDLTETLDIIRQEPVFEVKCITHRKDAIWQALLPGGLEHKILMGMPREATIFKRVNEVVDCLDVSLSPGGCSWLHAIVKINKKNEDDGKKAIKAAFKGHSSMKHCFVVDKDINILNPLEVEWAMATRFQGDKDIVAIGREPGSSLDPSGEPKTKMTYKMGFDLTKPVGIPKGKNFEKVKFHRVD